MKLFRMILLSVLVLGSSAALAEEDCSTDLTKNCAYLRTNPESAYPSAPYVVFQLRFAGSNVWYYLSFDGAPFGYAYINEKTGESSIKSKKDGEKILIGTIDASNMHQYAYREVQLNSNLAFMDKTTSYETKSNCIRSALGLSQRSYTKGLRHELTIKAQDSSQTATFFGDEVLSETTRFCFN